MMTLDEAIECEKALAREGGDDAATHLQYAEWLRQARGAEQGARYLTEKLRTRESENKDLRKQLGDADRINGRIVGENDNLRELAAGMLKAMRRMEESAGMDAMVGHSPWFAPKLRELGIEVDHD